MCKPIRDAAALMPDHHAYIAKETAISAVINIVIGTLFFIALYHGQDRVPLWGAGGIVVDCLPQGFMVGLMSVLPPSLITRQRMKKGKIAPLTARPSPLPANLVLRALSMAAVGMIGLTTASAALAALSGAVDIGFALGLPLKALAGGIVALVITPPALRAVLAARTG